MYFNKRLAFIFVLSSWLSCITAEVCFFHDEEKAFKKMNDFIDSMHPDNHEQVQHALKIAYQGMQIGAISFYKKINKARIKYIASHSVFGQLRIKLTNSLSSTHGILYGDVYQCGYAAGNVINMFYVSQNSTLLYEALTTHDKYIFEEIFNYFMVQKDKNKYIIPLHCGKYSYIRKNTV